MASSITIERHRVDGFTLWGSDKDGYLVHRRYIGYTFAEARRDFKRVLLGL